jgi:hypothetical protein
MGYNKLKFFLLSNKGWTTWQALIYNLLKIKKTKKYDCIIFCKDVNVFPVNWETQICASDFFLKKALMLLKAILEVHFTF